MKSCEEYVDKSSEYFIYTPSLMATDMLFYPLYVGNFIYTSGYALKRDSYDSFLLMYIKNGSLNIQQSPSNTAGASTLAHEGDFVLIDCYQPHSYWTDANCECLWCHFDGALARKFYDSIIARLGNVFSINDQHNSIHRLQKIYDIFYHGETIREVEISKYLNDILSSFLLYTPEVADSYNYEQMAETIIAYINEHFADDIGNNDLADIAGLSPYHFIRTFKGVTGFTPHEYIIITRINTAKYLLKNTSLSVKDICFRCGFSCESVFCNSFKKNNGITPASYRKALL